MKSAAQQWLTGRASPPGMLACGMREPGGNVICHSLEEICPVAKLEGILRHFDNLHTGCSFIKLNPRWTTWVFEQGQIRFVLRPDGWLLALVVRQESEAQPKLNPLSTEFLSLDLTN